MSWNHQILKWTIFNWSALLWSTTFLHTLLSTPPLYKPGRFNWSALLRSTTCLYTLLLTPPLHKPGSSSRCKVSFVVPWYIPLDFSFIHTSCSYCTILKTFNRYNSYLSFLFQSWIKHTSICYRIPKSSFCCPKSSFLVPLTISSFIHILTFKA